MLIAQITDVHLGFEPDTPDELNRRRLDQTIEAILRLSPRPDLLLISGDLADAGEDDLAYAALREAIAELPFPVYPAMGNHDDRAAFSRHFPEVASDGGFIQYAVEDHPLRILILDTLEEGRHGGRFCEIRADWLRLRLAEQPERATLIVLHHPPSPSGLSWMTEDADAEWVKRLEAVISAAGNVVALIAGHLHRPVVTGFAGTRLIVCPSTAPQVALDLAGIDPERPDDRPMIVEAPPGFALHLWTGRQLLTHFEQAVEHEVIARFTPKLQPLVRLLAAEREG
jgi:3',5'-cyclic AMP phosphodiesterase CpdA